MKMIRDDDLRLVNYEMYYRSMVPLETEHY